MSFGMYGAWVHVRPSTPATTFVAATASTSTLARK